MFASRFRSLALALSIGAASSIDAQITVRLSDRVDPEMLWISIGGRGEIEGVRIPNELAHKKSFKIVRKAGETSFNTTKLLMRGPRYLAHAYEFSDADDGKQIDVVLVPRRQLPFRGRVIGSENGLRGAHVTVGYLETWHCDFFGYIDCLSGYRPVARTRIDKNGYIRVKLPDFGTDPAVERFSGRTGFRFVIEDPVTGNILYILQPVPGEDDMHVKPRYDRKQIFTPRKV